MVARAIRIPPDPDPAAGVQGAAVHAHFANPPARSYKGRLRINCSIYGNRNKLIP